MAILVWFLVIDIPQVIALHSLTDGRGSLTSLGWELCQCRWGHEWIQSEEMNPLGNDWISICAYIYIYIYYISIYIYIDILIYSIYIYIHITNLTMNNDRTYLEDHALWLISLVSMSPKWVFTSINRLHIITVAY